MAMTKVQKLEKQVNECFSYQEGAWESYCQKQLKLLKGKAFKENVAPKYIVNTYYNLVNLIVPNLYYQNPYINVKPSRRFRLRKQKNGYLKENIALSAQRMENVLNKELRIIGYENEMRKAIQDAILFGGGVFKVGYSIDTESEDNIEYIKKESVFGQRISHFDFGFDTMATGPENAEILVHRLVKRLSDVKKQYGVRELKASIDKKTQEKVTKGNAKPGKPDDLIVLYEIHNQGEGKIYTIAHGNDVILDEKKNPHDFTGSHFSYLKFPGDEDEFIGIPMLGTVEDEVHAINDTVCMMLEHMKLFPGQLMYEEGALDDDELTAIEEGEQGSMLQTRPNALTGGKIQRTAPLQAGADYYNVLNTLSGLIDRVLGIPDFQRFSGKEKSATEASIEAADSSVRRAYFVSFVKRFVLNSTEKIAQLIQQYYTGGKMMMIDGDADAVEVEWTKEDIQGEFDFDFDVNTMQATTQARGQQLINALNVISAHPTLQPVVAKLDPDKLGLEIFKSMGINYDSLKKSGGERVVIFSPDEENMLAADGKIIADPHPNEDHELHINMHLPIVKELLSSSKERAAELMRHIEMHKFLLQSGGIVQADSTNMLQQGGNNNIMPMNSPASPMNQEMTPVQTVAGMEGGGSNAGL